jgi:ABC-type multidrug transport system permease subunit
MACHLCCANHCAAWFIWIHYISPFKYGFEALMINEFVGLEFKSPFAVLDG